MDRVKNQLMNLALGLFLVAAIVVPMVTVRLLLEWNRYVALTVVVVGVSWFFGAVIRNS